MSDSPRIPMSLAVANLSEVMESIDEGNFTETVTRLFDEKRLEVAAAIDRRVAFFDCALAQLQKLKDLSKVYSKAAEGLQNTIDWLEDNTKRIMQQMPDYHYKGTLGQFKIQNNQPALKVMIETGKTSLSGIIRETDIHQFKVEQKYLIRREFYCLNNEEIKNDLKNGATLSWATLTQGQRLKIVRK